MNLSKTTKAGLVPAVCFSLLALAAPAAAQKIEYVSVVSKPVTRSADLPGEFQPWLSVSLHARVAGYVEKVAVDRGSLVKQNDTLAELSAPEITAHITEAEARLQASDADRQQAEAQLAATQSTYDKLKKASETQGAVAGNELVQVQRQIEAQQSLIQSRRRLTEAATAVLRDLRQQQSYLQVAAPFDGVVTERLIHPGALVGPGNDVPLLTLQQLSKLRLVVAVPEEYSGNIPQGAKVSFKVPAFPERAFSATIARNSHTLEPKTRTLIIELDVTNTDGALAPGMYPTVSWPVRRAGNALMVPATAVVSTTERTFVIRNHAGKAEWVNVKKGATEGDLVEVTGALSAGDSVTKRASDETRDGSALPAK